MDLHHADVTISNKVKIVYFAYSGSEIVTQYYKVSVYEKVM